MILCSLSLDFAVGSLSTPSTRQEPSNSRVVSINILAGGGTQNNQEPERQVPSSVLQFLRALFPGGEIHVEDTSLNGTTAGSTSEHAATSGGSSHVPEAEPRVSDEGIFLSNILREIMPLISQQAGSEGNPSEDQTAQDSSTQVSMLHCFLSGFYCAIKFALISTSNAEGLLNLHDNFGL